MLLACILLTIVLIMYGNRLVDAMMKGIVIWTTYLLFITEILSFFNKLNRSNLVLSWISIDFLLVVLIFCGRKKIIRKTNFEFKMKFDFQIFCCFIIALASIFLAVRTTPYNYDSMTYHLARIAYWADNQSVAHYSTNILRQVASPVLAEFVMLHSYIILGKLDIFVNLVQCSSFIINSYAVWSIAKKIGCTKNFSGLATVMFMTTPIVFSESYTTQTDNYAAMWMLIFTYFIVDFFDIKKKIQFDNKTINKVIYISICVGLGYLSKPSVSMSMFIFALVLLCICLYRRDSMVTLIKLVLLALPCLVMTVITEIVRNFITFGAISSSSAGNRQLIGTLNPKYVFVNFIKDITFNMPNIYVQNSSEKIEKFVIGLANMMNVSINDSTISEDGVEFHVWNEHTFGIDTAINPIIVILSIVCCFILIYNIKKLGVFDKKNIFSICALCSFIVLCCVLRWEMFISRYMISYFALLSVMVAIQIQILFKNEHLYKYKYAVLGVIYFCCIVDFTSLLQYHLKISDEISNISREEGYFYNYQSFYPKYAIIEEIIKKNEYKRIGILMSDNWYDYPLYKMLSDDVDEIKQIGSENESSIYEDKSYIPDCIVVIGRWVGDSYEYNNTKYKVIYDFNEHWSYVLIKE